MDTVPSAPESFPHYPKPQAQIPHGLQVAGPKDHKPLMKLMKQMLKPRIKSRIKTRTWAKKKKFW